MSDKNDIIMPAGKLPPNPDGPPAEPKKDSKNILPKKQEYEYPVLKYKEFQYSLVSIIFSLIISIPVFLVSIAFFIAFLSISNGDQLAVFLAIISVPFTVLSGISIISSIIPIVQKKQFRKKGQNVRVLVHGYIEEDAMMQDQKLNTAKLLINTSKGKRFILHQCGFLKPFEAGAVINIIVYKKHYMINTDTPETSEKAAE